MSKKTSVKSENVALGGKKIRYRSDKKTTQSQPNILNDVITHCFLQNKVVLQLFPSLLSILFVLFLLEGTSSKV